MNFLMLKRKGDGFPAMSSLYYLVITFCFISYLKIFTSCLFKSIPLFCFSWFCLFFNVDCSLFASLQVHFMQKQSEMWLKIEKKPQNYCLILSFQVHFSLHFNYHFIDYHFLPSLHRQRWIWSLLFMWLLFWINETTQIFWPGFKNVVTVWLRSTSLMALKVRNLFTHSRSKIFPKCYSSFKF